MTYLVPGLVYTAGQIKKALAKDNHINKFFTLYIMYRSDKILSIRSI